MTSPAEHLAARATFERKADIFAEVAESLRHGLEVRTANRVASYAALYSRKADDELRAATRALDEECDAS